MATLSSGITSMGTSGVDGSSKIPVEKVESSFDFEHLLDSTVLGSEIVGVERHEDIIKLISQ